MKINQPLVLIIIVSLAFLLYVFYAFKAQRLHCLLKNESSLVRIMILSSNGIAFFIYLDHLFKFLFQKEIPFQLEETIFMILAWFVLSLACKNQEKQLDY